jgi:HAD superfamily hydrolase (TIGR01458 family)
MPWIDGVRGALIDVDGTLLDGARAIPGAAEAIERLRARGISFRLTTNTTRRPRSAIAAALRIAGIEVEAGEVLIPAFLARRRIVESGRRRAALLVPEHAMEDFEGIVEDREHPDWVVMGDLGAEFTFERLNQAFRLVREGASLLALHKNPFWRSGESSAWVLDAGAFVTAIEFATGVTAEVVGKPARAFFELALGDLGLGAREAMVVGDDVEADIRGGSAAGCRTVLVGTGKQRGRPPGEAGVTADRVIGSVAELFV